MGSALTIAVGLVAGALCSVAAPPSAVAEPPSITRADFLYRERAVRPLPVGAVGPQSPKVCGRVGEERELGVVPLREPYVTRRYHDRSSADDGALGQTVAVEEGFTTAQKWERCIVDPAGGGNTFWNHYYGVRKVHRVKGTLTWHEGDGTWFLPQVRWSPWRQGPHKR